jgi:hypothetical protein
LPTNISIIATLQNAQNSTSRNIWQFMRDNWLSNRVFGSYDEIVEHCCEAWNKLVEQPWKLCRLACEIEQMVLISESWYNGYFNILIFD